MQDDRGMIYGLQERVPAGWIMRKLTVERSRVTEFGSSTPYRVGDIVAAQVREDGPVPVLPDGA
jgi:hypothetical protein